MKQFLTTAHRLADLSAAAILAHFRTSTRIANKADAAGFDPVTVADRAAEQAMRDALAEAHPTHAILGEEFGSKDGPDEHCWVLDPIDGTRAFILGLPTWGTLIGLTRDGRPVLGVMNQPFTGERYWGCDDGAFYAGPGGDAPSERFQEKRTPVFRPKTRQNKKLQPGFDSIKTETALERFKEKWAPVFRPKTRQIKQLEPGFDSIKTEKALRVSAQTELENAFLAATAPDMFGEGHERERFAALSDRVRMTRFGGDCYAYCRLAAGQIDLVVEADLKPYDIVALIPIIEAAGGVVTTWEGGPAAGGGRVVAAATPQLHEAALKVLSG